MEVLDNDEWGTVCDAGWDLTDAGVVCKNMGCGTPVEAMIGAFFGQGSGSVLLENVTCSGNELSITRCPSNGLGTSVCTHKDDAGVVCRGKVKSFFMTYDDAFQCVTVCETIFHTEVKLVNGTGPCDGRVQVLYTGHWGSVCNTGWGLEEATVLCRELGCGEVTKLTSYAGPFDGPRWMDNVVCRGKELTLRSCSFTGWGVSGCGDGHFAGVTCNSKIFFLHVACV